MPSTTAPTGPHPTLRVAGKFLAITDTTGQLGYFLRDAVTTAYLVLLDQQERESGQRLSVRGRASVVRRLELEHGMLHHDAVQAVLAADMLIRHDLEP